MPSTPNGESENNDDHKIPNITTYEMIMLNHFVGWLDKRGYIIVKKGERCDYICEHGTHCGYPKGHAWNHSNGLNHTSTCMWTSHNEKSSTSAK